MKIYPTTKGIVIDDENQWYVLNADWDEFINDDDLFRKIKLIIQQFDPWQQSQELIKHHLTLPVKSQEIWASGVTYFNSKLARQEESAKAGGGNFYEKVYHADRPELFFKATAQRTVSSGQKVRIRKDSVWDVPEPELTLVITSSGKIVGYTIGNDMSSRSIEGENPLYLPQAKTYDGCASVGPCILVAEGPLSKEVEISMTVLRGGESIFEGG
ncbi:MAG: fumarylacetoacetate hydrolase family protein, partial [Bacteroidota bacterium]